MFKIVKDSFSATHLQPHQIEIIENLFNEAPKRYENRNSDVVDEIRHNISLVMVVLGYKIEEVK